MHRRFLLISLSLFLAACSQAPMNLALAPGSTLIVTRHADRDGEDLNARGRARAQALVRALDGMALDGIYSPGIRRNLDTAAPLAAARALDVNRVPQEAPTATLVRDGAGGTVIWIGNKGNIATIWDDLSLPEPAPLEYGDLHIIRSDAEGTTSIERRRYGPS